MREALFYEPGKNLTVHCQLCPHNCQILPGNRGICGVRENQAGVLYSLVYGKVVSTSIDPIEKKPLFHFLPGSQSYSIATVGCNLKCLFCQNYSISQVDRQKPEIVGQLAEPDEIVASALVNNCASISYTYTEPTIFYEFALDTARIAKTKGLKNIFVSNGFINPAPLEKIAPFLDAANVDLKSFSEDYYRQICGARLQPVLETLKLMKKLGIWLEVTTLVIPGLNDSDDELWQIASFIKEELSADVPWHISGFYPTYKLLDRPPTDEATLNRGREIGLKMGLNYVYTGNRRIPGSEDTYCSKCQRAVIKRSGFQVKENNLKMASCSFCGEKIAGVFMP